MTRYDIARSGWHRSVVRTDVARVLPEIAADARRIIAKGTRFEIRGIPRGVDVMLLSWVATREMQDELVTGLLDSPRRRPKYVMYGRLEA